MDFITNIKAKADNGDVSAMVVYARAKEYGNNKLPVDKQEALKYFKMAADKGNTAAMCAYANMVKNGDGVSVDKQKALKYYKMAADKGNDRGMYNYGLILNQGDGVSVNKQEALKYYKMAIDRKNTNAMNDYAIMLYYDNNIPTNKREAIRYFKQAIAEGNTVSMVNYATILMDDYKNEEEAVKYYEMAMNMGSSDAYFCYAGILLDKNDSRAIPYLKKSIDMGNTDAMHYYALILQQGYHTKINKQEALKYFKMAADKGHPDATNEYALMLNDDTSVVLNRKKAIEYFIMTINKGNFNAFRICKDPYVLNELLKYIHIKKINIYDKNISIENGKIIKINNSNWNEQGKKQVIIDRYFEYDGNGNLVKIKDVAFHTKTKVKIYEVDHYKDNKAKVNYFDLKGNFLASADIDNNEIKFDNKNKCDLEKINKIINSYEGEETNGFDNILSFLTYLPLQTEYDKKVIIINCDKNVELLKKTVEDSKKNKDCVYICNLNVSAHNVQHLIINGENLTINTGSDEYFQLENERELKFFNQKIKNCVISSKVCLVNLLIQIMKYNKNAKKMGEAEIKLDELSKTTQELTDIKNEYLKTKYPYFYDEKSGAAPKLQEEHIECIKIIIITMLLIYENNKNLFLEMSCDFAYLIHNIHEKETGKDTDFEKKFNSIKGELNYCLNMVNELENLFKKQKSTKSRFK